MVSQGLSYLDGSTLIFCSIYFQESNPLYFRKAFHILPTVLTTFKRAKTHKSGKTRFHLSSAGISL